MFGRFVVNNTSVFAKNAFEVRNKEGEMILLLCAKSPEDKEAWLGAFSRETELVRADKEAGR